MAETEQGISKRGYFWLFDGSTLKDDKFAPPTALPGLLSIDRNGLTTLKVDGSLLTKELPSGPPLFGGDIDLSGRKIAGRMTDDSSLVYLHNLRLADFRNIVTDRVVCEVYRAETCLVGTASSEGLPYEPKYGKMIISLTGLEQWLRNDAIDAQIVDVDGVATTEEVKYLTPRTEYATDDGKLVLRTSVHGGQSILYLGPKRKVLFEQEDYLDFLPNQPTAVGNLAMVFSQIEEFIAIVTGTYVWLEWPYVVCTVGKNESWYKLYVNRVRTGLSPPDLMDLWTTLPGVRQTFGSLFNHWRRKQADFGPGTRLYLGTLRNPSLYVEHRFMNLMWGIESLHRREIGDAGKSRRRSPTSLEKRLFDVFSTPPLSLDKKCLRKLATRCADRRNDISHFGESRDESEDSETFLRDIIRLSEAVSYVLHAYLLHSIGLEQAALHKAFHQSPLSWRIRRSLREVGFEFPEE